MVLGNPRYLQNTCTFLLGSRPYIYKAMGHTHKHTHTTRGVKEGCPLCERCAPFCKGGVCPVYGQGHGCALCVCGMTFV